MPQKKEEKTWLTCPDCEHREKPDEEEYKFGKENENNGSRIAIVEEESKKKIEEPNYDLDNENYTEMYEEGY